MLLCACDLHFGTLPPTATRAPTPPPAPSLIVVWAAGGNLFAWRERDQALRQIASGAVIRPYLSPHGDQVAFTRGAQGDAISLWVVGIDGVGEQQVVAPTVIKSIRNGHPQINRVAWLDDQTLYFNTFQQYTSGSSNDDDLYRAQIGSPPQLILPPGAGGDFALSPDRTRIAVVRAGQYDMQKGAVALLDPLGVKMDEKLTFTALRTPDEVPFYPPLAWSADSSSVRVPIPDRASDRVALWKLPAEAGSPAIFGYISAAPQGLPVWSADGEWMVYLRDGSNGMTDLLLADDDGGNPVLYDNGSIANRHWLPNSDLFAYDLSGAIWIGQRNQPPRKLIDAPVQGVIFAGGDAYVYATPSELHAGHLNAAGSMLLGTFTAPPLFDALVAP
ncbi:MAG TPA: hypothetical protein VHD90_00420 [Phototrophicaceae bacterium]|nr:hypothetical protein [Phototrophicaceae bacterium]